MTEINLAVGAVQRERLKCSASEISGDMLELQELITDIRRQVGMEDFLLSLSSAVEELQTETRILKEMEKGLGEILKCFRDTETRISLEYQQEKVFQIRIDWNSVYYANTLLKDMGIRLRI